MTRQLLSYAPLPFPVGDDAEDVNAYLSSELLKISDALKPQPYYGSMYVASTLTVPISTANPTEVADSTSDGWTEGLTRGVVFPTGGGEHYMAITLRGVYEISWDLSVYKTAGGSTEVHAGFMVDGTAVRDSGEGHRTIAASNDEGSVSGHALYSLPSGDEEISLWAINDLSNDVIAEHGNLVIRRIGDIFNG